MRGLIAVIVGVVVAACERQPLPDELAIPEARVKLDAVARQTNTPSLQGVVLQSGTPLDDVRVSLVNLNFAPIANVESVKTDAQGRFVLKPVPSGVNIVVVEGTEQWLATVFWSTSGQTEPIQVNPATTLAALMVVDLVSAEVQRLGYRRWHIEDLSQLQFERLVDACRQVTLNVDYRRTLVGNLAAARSLRDNDEGFRTLRDGIVAGLDAKARERLDPNRGAQVADTTDTQWNVLGRLARVDATAGDTPVRVASSGYVQMAEVASEDGGATALVIPDLGHCWVCDRQTRRWQKIAWSQILPGHTVEECQALVSGAQRIWGIASVDERPALLEMRGVPIDGEWRLQASFKAVDGGVSAHAGGLAFDDVTQALYLPSNESGTIVRLTLNDGVTSKLATDPNSAGLSSPVGVAYASGALYVTDDTQNELLRFDPASNKYARLVSKQGPLLNGVLNDARLARPGVLVKGNGSQLFLSDASHGAIRVLDSQKATLGACVSAQSMAEQGVALIPGCRGLGYWAGDVAALDLSGQIWFFSPGS